ncbi:MAG: sensor histidine kinase [Butyrivibrio sp.]|nr:sensor histidine kinase [Butyrivibrio sp.]
MNIKFSVDNLRHRFRYSIDQLREFEWTEEMREQKTRTMMIIMFGFLIYTILTFFPCIIHRYYHGAVTNISIGITFTALIFYLWKSRNHVVTTIVGVYAFDAILFFHFIMETNWDIGMDAFWLFILITPFITDFIAGVIYGTIASFGGLLLGFLLLNTPLSGYLQPYGKNMMDWYTIIYLVVMVAAAISQYELTASQIDKKVSDEKLAYYQQERTNRLKEQLSIYESNEQTIRKYKHDIRHYNRVLAGFIQNKEYEKAEAYLSEFDSMLEKVTAVSFCDNNIVNELLTIYASRCQKMGFKLRVKAIVPDRFPMEEMDLTSLVANALENAVEAQNYVDKENRSLQVEITYDGRKLKLMTKNPCAVTTKFNEKGLPVSTRMVQSGIGTAQIKSIAEKYGGVASFTQENDFFLVKAVMTCL